MTTGPSDCECICFSLFQRMIYFPVYKMRPPHLLMSSQTQRKNVKNFPAGRGPISPPPHSQASLPSLLAPARPCAQRPQASGSPVGPHRPRGSRFQAQRSTLALGHRVPERSVPLPGSLWAGRWLAGDSVDFQGLRAFSRAPRAQLNKTQQEEREGSGRRLGRGVPAAAVHLGQIA